MLQMANKTLVEFNRTRTCMHVETNILITSSFHFALNTQNYPISGNVNFISIVERKYEKHKAQFHNGRFFPVYEVADFFRVLVSIHCISTGHMQCMGVTHYSHSFFFFYFHLKYIKNKHDELLGLMENGKIHPKNEQKCNSKKRKKFRDHWRTLR